MTKYIIYLLLALGILGGLETKQAHALTYDPITNTWAANLSWLASTDSRAQGYQILVGNAPGLYSTTLDAGAVTAYTVTNLQNGFTYYFVAESYNKTLNLISAPSNEVTATIPFPPTPTPTPAPLQPPTNLTIK